MDLCRLVARDVAREFALRSRYGVEISAQQITAEVARIESTPRAPETLVEIKAPAPTIRHVSQKPWRQHSLTLNHANSVNKLLASSGVGRARRGCQRTRSSSRRRALPGFSQISFIGWYKPQNFPARQNVL